MVEISNKNNNKVVRVSVGGNSGNNPSIKPNGDYSSYYSELSKAWAIKMDGMVSKEDYSSKYYATQAKANAETTENNLNSVISEHEQITNEITEARENISGDLTGALTDIVNARDNGVAKVIETKTNSLSEIESAKSEAKQTITTGLNNFNTNAQAKSDSLQTQFDTSISNIKKQETTSINAIKKTGFYMQDDKLYYINADGETKEFISGGGRELLEIYIDPFCDESENKGRIANGQIIAQNQFPEATKKLKKRVGWDSENKKATLNTSLVCTEEEWQAIKTASKLGQCGKFVIDDEAGTIRLPAIVNINGLTDLSKCGLVKDESLPNAIYYSDAGWDNNSDATSKSLVASKDGGYEINNTGKGLLLGTNQSTSPAFSYSYGKLSSNNSTYQDNAPVQQEAVQYPYVICVNTGVEEAERPINNYQVNNTNSYGDNKYVGNTILNNLSWLRSVGQENPAGVHQDFFNWAVANIGQPFGAGLIKESTATDITEYDLVINKSKQTFILPTLNGEENIISAKYSAMNINGSPYNFTAPANGWLYMSGTAVSSNNEYIAVYIDKAKTTPIIGRNPLTGASITYLVPVFKGQEVIIEYTASNISRCKFIYAKGNGNLYYYVGDTLQNVDLINIARMQEQLVDKADKKDVPHLAMPSNKSVSLTLSTQKMRLPASGFVYLKRAMTSAGYQNLENYTANMSSEVRTHINGGFLRNFIFGKKGDLVGADYDGSYSGALYTFIYAEGEVY
nr:MAG TPA: hypothetical protein [Caudoviricetes sp.]